VATLSLVFCKSKNFGDRLNVDLAGNLGIATLRHNTRDVVNDDVAVLGIGTILNDRLKVQPSTRLIVFGSGFGYPQKAIRLPRQLDIRFLRGPLSCQALGLPLNVGLADGGYLFRDEFRRLAKGVRQSEAVGYLPHHASLATGLPLWREPWLTPQRIDPSLPPKDYVRRVAACRHIVTECLHGAILADILRIPFTVVQTAPSFDSFKWLDWATALGLDLSLAFLSAETAPTLASRAMRPTGDRVLNDRCRRIFQAFQRLKAELAQLGAGGGASAA
jgi:succinoglycan biosynthesis protein ExoV